MIVFCSLCLKHKDASEFRYRHKNKRDDEDSGWCIPCEKARNALHCQRSRAKRGKVVKIVHKPSPKPISVLCWCGIEVFPHRKEAGAILCSSCRAERVAAIIASRRVAA